MPAPPRRQKSLKFNQENKPAPIAESEDMTTPPSTSPVSICNGDATPKHSIPTPETTTSTTNGENQEPPPPPLRQRRSVQEDEETKIEIRKGILKKSSSARSSLNDTKTENLLKNENFTFNGNEIIEANDLSRIIEREQTIKASQSLEESFLHVQEDLSPVGTVVAKFYANKVSIFIH